MRSILLAAVLGEKTTSAEFWDHYRSDGRPLAGLRVHDPFMGGGSTLVEAARLGGAVSGTDVDPTARVIVAHSLEPAAEDDVVEAGNDLMSYLRDSFSSLYPDDDGEPLHSFWVHIVTCPRCNNSGPLYRSLVLARDSGKPGAVVRDDAVTVFDPDTFELRYLRTATQKTFQAAGRRLDASRSTFDKGKYRCPSCWTRSTLRDLQTGTAPRRLVAVERTPAGGRRKLLEPTTQDFGAIEQAREMLNDPPVPLRIPMGEFDAARRDPRPRSFGMTAVRDLFAPRQLLVLGAAHSWIDQQRLPESTERAIRLALSNCLTTNNRLCSYATDYGRLSALFSVRGYSLPALPVELNPLHSSGGRGTIQQCLDRVARSAATTVRRATWNVGKKVAEIEQLDLPRRASEVDLRCSSAATASIAAPIDLLVFDPPYYDYINYDELAELFRSWNPGLVLSGQTLQSTIGGDGSEFGVFLADCLRPAIRARAGRHPIAFTYHSSNPAAWEAIGIALDEAKLGVTAMWPLRSDGRMGHHSHPGNCEWDVVVVCRPLIETTTAQLPRAEAFWTPHFGDLDVSDADLASFDLAYKMATDRFVQLGSVAMAKKVRRES